ncbi:Man1-Src1p-C-terminal domain-containing protein [Schizophyllum commune]
MSRLTTAQVIAQGHYLDPDFNPASLTVSQLLGVFGYHNIQYPTPYNKPTLVKLFNDEIKAKAKKFKRERVKKDNSLASDDGITDGVTGQPLNGGRAASQPRRSSRRLSRQPSEESEQLVALPDPPKRRRSSAQPAAAPSKRAAPQPILIEESEPEDEVEEAPPRKVGRRKKNDGDDESEYEQGEEYEDVEVPIKGEEDDDDEKVNAVAQRISEGPRRKLSPPKLQAEEVAPPSPIRRLFLTIILLALGYFTWSYKQESAQIGFCTFERNGEPMNQYLLDLRKRRAQIEEECHLEQQKQMNGTADVNSTPSFGNSTICAQAALLPVPDACTPCPAHADCSRTNVTCHEKYVLKPNMLLFLAPPHAHVDLEGKKGWLDYWRLFDGLPGLGPVAFPPRCVDDGNWETDQLKKAQRLAIALRTLRSKRLCTGNFQRFDNANGGEARQWGVSYDELLDIFSKMPGGEKERHKVKKSLNEALVRLMELEVLFEGRDSSGQRYFANRDVKLSWNCWAKVSIRETWAYYRLYVFAIVASTLFAWYQLRSWRAQKIDTERARDLALEVLETLQNQVRTHYSDPVRAPERYVGSARMRDLLLQREWNNSYRNKIWKRVEKLVEGNENVRANLAEEGGGDEMRVWQWVGSVGMTPMRPRRNSNPFAPEYDEGEDFVAQ